jgi:hypothetical protein
MSTPTRILDGIRKFYQAPWILVTEVSSFLGEDMTGEEDKRRADVLAIRPGRPIRIVGFEVKASRNDWQRERRDPQKARAWLPYCEAWYLVVESAKEVIPDLGELVVGSGRDRCRWGLLEVGGGRRVRETEPEGLSPIPLTEDRWQGILRALARDTERGGAPLCKVTRPHLSRLHCGLDCGHVIPKPRDESKPIPCPSCAIGAPMDLEVAEAVIGDAEIADLRRLREQIETRLGALEVGT